MVFRRADSPPVVSRTRRPRSRWPPERAQESEPNWSWLSDLRPRTKLLLALQGDVFLLGFSHAWSVTAQRGPAIPMEYGVAEKKFRTAGALEEETDIVFVGHADSPVHLDSLVGDFDVGRGQQPLGQ